MLIRQYLAALWADWVARMSGIASIILAFLAAYLEFIVKHGKASLWVTAAICFCVASYRIWASEREKVLNQQKGTLWPEFQGELVEVQIWPLRTSDIYTSEQGITRNAKPLDIGSTFLLKLYFVNTQPVETTIRRFSLTIKDGDKTYTAPCAEAGHIMRYLFKTMETQEVINLERYVAKSIALKRGKGVEGYLKFNVIGLLMNLLGNDPAYAVTITDAFSNSHDITKWGPLFKPNESIIVPPIDIAL